MNIQIKNRERNTEVRERERVQGKIKRRGGVRERKIEKVDKLKWKKII